MGAAAAPPALGRVFAIVGIISNQISFRFFPPPSGGGIESPRPHAPDAVQLGIWYSSVQVNVAASYWFSVTGVWSRSRYSRNLLPE